jgi:hypothetical protein
MPIYPLWTTKHAHRFIRPIGIRRAMPDDLLVVDISNQFPPLSAKPLFRRMATLKRDIRNWLLVRLDFAAGVASGKDLPGVRAFMG